MSSCQEARSYEEQYPSKRDPREFENKCPNWITECTLMHKGFYPVDVEKERDKEEASRENDFNDDWDDHSTDDEYD